MGFGGRGAADSLNDRALSLKGPAIVVSNSIWVGVEVFKVGGVGRGSTPCHRSGLVRSCLVPAHQCICGCRPVAVSGSTRPQSSSSHLCMCIDTHCNFLACVSFSFFFLLLLLLLQNPAGLRPWRWPDHQSKG